MDNDRFIIYCLQWRHRITATICKSIRWMAGYGSKYLGYILRLDYRRVDKSLFPSHTKSFPVISGWWFVISKGDAHKTLVGGNLRPEADTQKLLFSFCFRHIGSAPVFRTSWLSPHCLFLKLYRADISQISVTPPSAKLEGGCQAEPSYQVGAAYTSPGTRCLRRFRFTTFHRFPPQPCHGFLSALTPEAIFSLLRPA